MRTNSKTGFNTDTYSKKAHSSIKKDSRRRDRTSNREFDRNLTRNYKDLLDKDTEE